MSVTRKEPNWVYFSHPAILYEVPRDYLFTTLNYHSQFAGISILSFNGATPCDLITQIFLKFYWSCKDVHILVYEGYWVSHYTGRTNDLHKHTHIIYMLQNTLLPKHNTRSIYLVIIKLLNHAVSTVSVSFWCKKVAQPNALIYYYYGHLPCLLIQLGWGEVKAGDNNYCLAHLCHCADRKQSTHYKYTHTHTHTLTFFKPSILRA